MCQRYLKYVPVVPYYPIVPRDDKYHREVRDNTADLTEIDAIDREIMSLVTKDYSSSYSIWSAMIREVKEKKIDRKVMTYRNTNKRVVRLSRLGLLEELKPDKHVVNLHGRKDYKLTMKGMEELIPTIITHPEEVQNIVQYMDKFGLNKEHFWPLLLERLRTMFATIGEYHRYTLLTVGVEDLGEIYLASIMDNIARGEKTQEEINEELNAGLSLDSNILNTSSEQVRLQLHTIKILQKLPKKEMLSLYTKIRNLKIKTDKSFLNEYQKILDNYNATDAHTSSSKKKP